MILEGMAKAAASFQGFYRTSVVRLDYLLIIYIYIQLFHDYEGKQSNYCPELVEKVCKSLGQQFPKSSPLLRDRG